MGSDTPQRRRPTVVTIAVVIWWVTTLVQLVVSVPRFVAAVREGGAVPAGALIGILIAIAWSALLVWLAARMGRGSGNSRLWLAIIAAFAVVSTAISLAGGAPMWGLVDPMAIVIAVVLSYLPSARAFFPKVERRARTAEPRTIGWDPTTGERITETTN